MSAKGLAKAGIRELVVETMEMIYFSHPNLRAERGSGWVDSGLERIRQQRSKSSESCYLIKNVEECSFRSEILRTDCISESPVEYFNKERHLLPIPDALNQNLGIPT